MQSRGNGSKFTRALCRVFDWENEVYGAKSTNEPQKYRCYITPRPDFSPFAE
jgi:hypothetical protein